VTFAHLTASLEDKVDIPAFDIGRLHTDRERFSSQLGGTDGESPPARNGDR
jgi:hypothetical protein